MQFMNQQVLANCTDLRHLFLSQNEIAKVPPKLLEVILIFFIFIPMIFVHYYSFRQNRCSKQSICREINWLQFQKASPRIVFTTLWAHPIFVSKYNGPYRMTHICKNPKSMRRIWKMFIWMKISSSKSQLTFLIIQISKFWIWKIIISRTLLMFSPKSPTTNWNRGLLIWPLSTWRIMRI